MIHHNDITSQQYIITQPLRKPMTSPVLRVKRQVCHLFVDTVHIGPTWGPSGANRTQVGPMLDLCFTMCICTDIYGSMAFPELLPIDVENQSIKAHNLNSAKMHFGSKFGNSNFNWWQVMAWTSSRWDKIYILIYISTWLSGSINPKAKGILTKAICTFDPNLVKLAWMGDELWCRLAHTHPHMDRQTQAMAIPEGQNLIQAKMTHRGNH